MELAQERLSRDRLISTEDGLPLARVATPDGETITAEDISDTRPVVPVTTFDAASRVAAHGARSQVGLLQLGRKGKASVIDTPREYDRHEQSSYRRRSKKANARHQKRVRDARMDRDTLLAQIRVASGKTGASPALVANAQKALERRVADVRAENPGMTEEQAAELVFSVVIGQ